MKHKVVVGTWSEPGLPFSRAACEALAAIGVESAVEHIRAHGGHTRPEWSEMIQDYVNPVRDPNVATTTSRLRPQFLHHIVEIEGERYAVCKAGGVHEYVKTPTQWTVIS